MTDINAKHLDGAGLSHVFGKIKSALDNRMNDSVKYLYRAVSETEGAPSGLATIDSIHGNTLRWNQLGYGYSADSPVHGITFAFANGVQSAIGTASGTGNSRICNKPAVIGHKYLAKANNLHFGSENTSSVRVVRNYNQVVVFSASNTAYIVDTSGSPWTSGDTIGIQIVAPDGTVVDLSFIPQIFDLTAMFGAGNEPATVAEFEALYPLPYYPYDPGSLLPVRMEGVETVGFNQWDEEWEVGTISSTTGQNSIDSTVWRTKNYIPVFPGATYYATGTPVSGTDGNMRGRFYAADKTYIGDADASNQSLRLNRAFTVPSGARFLRFAPQNSQIVDKRICINISDPARNGTYEQHWSSQRTIPATDLRSAGTVYDEQTATERITRVGEVDLGTLTWTAQQNTSNIYAAVIATLQPTTTNASRLDGLTCSMYSLDTIAGVNDDMGDKTMKRVNQGVYIKDTAYADAAAFKTAMSGVMLHYALAAPTTTSIDPPLALRYKVDSDGTERIMVDERKDAPQSAPVPMDVTYGISLYDSAVDDGMSIAHVRDVVGEPDRPYTEVEWVESDGTQFVYLDWKPPIATWGFEADFIIRNAFSTSVGAWRSDTNANGYGNVFGTRNASMVNDVQFGTYDNAGVLRNGTGSYSVSGILKTDKTRQTVSYRGTSLKRGDGTTVTFARTSETANKYYANMVVFAMHEGARRSVTGNLAQPGTVRIYSLKFYDGTTLEVDLVGAIRNSDGTTGLYDKIKGHFYPAQGMTYGAVVGDLGEPDTVEQALAKKSIIAYVDNRTDTRMLRATVPSLDKLDDGQQVTVVYSAPISGSVQTTELAGWDDTAGNGYVYLKLTLADGSQTEWLPCYFSNNGRLTSHYGSGTPVLLTYRENVFINASTTNAGTSVMRGWWANPDYNSDDVYTRYSDTLLAGLNGVKRYSLNMRDANGNWTSIMNQDNNTGATGKTAYTGGLMLGNILYHNSGSNIAAGGNTGQMKESNGGVDFRYDVNGVANAASTELQYRKPVYLVGTVHSDGLFYLDQTKWWTQTSFEEGKVYVHVGTAYSSYYAIFLSVNNPAYIYDGTKLIDFTPIEVGGRNLLCNTEWTSDSITKFGANNATLGNAIGLWRKEPNAVVAMDESGLMTLTSSSTTRYGIYQDVVLESGRYVFSGQIGSRGTVCIGPVQWPAPQSRTTNGRFAQIIDVSSSATYRVYIAEANGNVSYVNWLKLERGNTPTDWTPASEDYIKKSGDTMTGYLTLGSNNTSTVADAGIKVNDVRSATLTNNMINNAANFYFTSSGTPDTKWWSLLHVKGWTGGYAAWELAGTAHNTDDRNKPLYVRTGNASNAFGAWREIFDSGHTIPIANGGTGATTAAGAIESLGAATAKDVKEVYSRGEQLIVNGNGFMGDNSNFSGLTFDGSKANGSPGSFTKSATSQTVYSDTMFPVDPSKRYKAEFDVMAEDPGAAMYVMLVFYDVDKKVMSVQHVSYFDGSTTTLAQDLKNGDTKVYLTSAAGFHNTTAGHQRALIFWNYTNSFGYTYPPETYSRNFYDNLWSSDSSVDKTNNTITLSTAWSKGTIPAGTPVSQNMSGSNYSYFWYITNKASFPREWTHISGEYNGVRTSGTANGTGKFWPGTAYCRIGWLWNHTSGGTGQGRIWVTNVSVKMADADNVTGIVQPAHGGTGQTSLTNSANALINSLSTGTSTPSDNDYYVSQYAGGGTTTTTYHRRPMSALWAYIKGKIESLVLSTSTSSTSTTTAATSSAVKTAYDLANTANGTANTALSGVNGTLIYDHTYTIANGVATFTAHVYCKGQEVTSNYQDSAFSWSYRLSDAISETGTPSVVSLGTGKTKTINITTLGLGGHVIGTFTTD